MSFWAIVKLILVNFKYVAKFVQIIDQKVKDGVSERDLNASLDLLEKGFSKDETIEEAASSASDINDAFKL